MHRPSRSLRKDRIRVGRAAALSCVVVIALTGPLRAQMSALDDAMFGGISGPNAPITGVEPRPSTRPSAFKLPPSARAQSMPAAPSARKLKARRNAVAPTGPKTQRAVRLGVGVEETYTSNVRREPKALSDFVTTVSPSISVLQHREAVDANINATFNYQTHLRKTESNRLNVDLQGLGQIRLVPDLASVDVRGFITQQQTNAIASSQTERSLSGATGERTIQGYTIGPQLGSRIGDWAHWSLGYRLGQTFASAPVNGTNLNGLPNAPLSDTQTNKVSASLETGEGFSFYRARLAASDSETKRTGAGGSSIGDLGATNLELTNQYLILPHLSAILVIGNDQYRIPRATQDLSGPYAQAGFSLNAGSRAELRFLAGRRFNDVSFAGEARYQPFKQLRVGLAYTDSVSTQQNQFLESLSQATSDEAGNLINVRTLQPFSANAPTGVDLNDSVFREQRLSSNASITGVRNVLTLNGFMANRTSVTQQSAAPNAAPATQQSIGSGLQLNHTFSHTTSGQVGVNGALSTVTGPTARPDSVSMQVAASVTERLSPSATLKFKLGYLDQYYLNADATPAAATGLNAFRPIKEMIATVGLRKEF